MKGKVCIGLGFDVHPLVPERRLVLGGVEIPFAKGLSGWSDADALTHAIIDALLGAANLGDIGQHFPPGKSEYQDISSLILLSRIKNRLKEKGWAIGNIDATIVAEQPKLSDFIEPIRARISQGLDIPPIKVSIKSKTTNRLGLIGRGEGISAYAIALIEGDKSESF